MRLVEAIQVDMTSKQCHKGTPGQRRIPLIAAFWKWFQLIEQIQHCAACRLKLPCGVGLFRTEIFALEVAVQVGSAVVFQLYPVPTPVQSLLTCQMALAGRFAWTDGSAQLLKLSCWQGGHALGLQPPMQDQSSC